MFQIPATFLKIPYAVDYCGFHCCLSSGKRARKLLVKSRSVGERIEISWLRGQTSRIKELMLNELDMGTNREVNIVGSLTNLSTRWTLGTAMLKEQRFGDCGFFTFLFYLIFMSRISS